ncbi:NUMOD1 domain-containing DNA-binding protein [Enterococcus cecorum]|uniref:NUMOD1 domain-containing DNA-binding protein n=1 Tax=Enterococcus cecorum TaxID=44008 RepID=UPI000AB8EFF7|nr:NUMOD1 domain-containing DNA-binding protein [Enterococcus cecorum]CAI3425860.1 HNH endonuclease [Enterococcus cecorum]
MDVYECKICGKLFSGRKKKYCSQACSDEARRIRNRDRWRKDHPDWDKDVNKICVWCGKSYEVKPRYASQSRFCSDECRQTWYSRQKGHKPMEEHLKELEQQKEEAARIKEAERKARIKTKVCTECGETFETIQPNQLTCSKECSRLRKNRLKRHHKEKRYNETNLIDKDITVNALYKRDKGICYICGGECDFDDHQSTDGHFICGPTYPSIDHVIPIARGGMHAWDNVKLAHHLRNAKKSDILPSELKLDTEIEEAYALARKVASRKKQVKQFNKDGKLINIYESTAEAERQTGIKCRGIQNCARGETKAYKGYVWSY